MKLTYELKDSNTDHQVKINLKWILETLPTPLIVAIIILGITSSFEAILNGYIMGQIIKVNLSDLGSVTRFILQAFIAYLITYLSAYSFLMLKNQAIKILNVKLKQTFFKNAFNGDQDESDITNSITTISKQIEQSYFNSIFMLIQTGLTIISTTIFILGTHFLLGSIYIVLSFLSLIPSYLGRKKLDVKVKEWSTSNSELLNNTSDTFRGRTEIRNFDVKSLFFSKINRLLNKEELNYRNLSNYQTTLMLYAWGFAILTYLGPIAIGLYLAQFSSLGITTSIIVSLILTADSVVGNMRSLTSLQNAVAGTNGIRTIAKSQQPKIIKDHSENSTAGLVIKNLQVNRGPKVILDNINLTLTEQEKALITGPSGVGKSTLLSAISGQVNKANGNVYFNQSIVDNSDYVYISQDIWLFDGTLRDNLTLFENYSDEVLTEVIQKVGLLEELGDHALDMEIKNKGENVSGGQAQRIAIARGLLRDKKLFILDEITSSLDVKNAKKIHDLIYQLPVTVIESAHNYDDEQLEQYAIKKLVLSSNGLNPVTTSA
ncbi:ABC transporter ATP-binding protein [Holzapfeliella sp. He02]|uniref:ABC transporter ATP-binding protein n=1 Tax=Holzapfeliella saturejae TaxID=3082953 RepID=A0ABU8SIW4_9LACO